jgi:hypothetical protein
MRKINISKETLELLYLQQHKTSYEIAKLLFVDRSTINRYLTYYNIPANHNQRKFEQIKLIPFKQIQKDLIVGTLLGDGCISKKGSLSVSHCEKQKELTQHKFNILQPFTNSIHISTSQNSIMHSFSTIQHPELKFYQNLFYSPNKIIKNELLSYLTPTALAFWLMDDGSCGKSQNKTYIILHTEGFSKDDNIKLQSFLRSFNIDSTLRSYKYNFLYIPKEFTIKLSNLVKPFIIDCMRYKIYE